MLYRPSCGIRLIFAKDPDADLFAVVEKVGESWHQFTGDRLGVLFGCYIIQKQQSVKHCLLLNSAASSRMLSYIGLKGDYSVEECSTGFKWLGNRAQQTGSDAYTAYEEVLGYRIPIIMYEKDGITTAIVSLMVCCACGSPLQKLQGLYKRYGYLETMNTYSTGDHQSCHGGKYFSRRYPISGAHLRHTLVD